MNKKVRTKKFTHTYSRGAIETVIETSRVNRGMNNCKKLLCYEGYLNVKCLSLLLFFSWFPLCRRFTLLNSFSFVTVLWNCGKK